MSEPTDDNTERPLSDAPELLPEIYQKALFESVSALQIITQLVGNNLESGDIQKLLKGFSTNENDIFIDKLAELLRQTSGLLLVSKHTSDTLSLDVLLPRMVELISEALQAERCTIFLHDRETDELFTKAAVGLSGEIRIPSDHGIVGAVFRGGEPLIIDDAYADPRFNREVDLRTGFHTRNLLCVPLRHARDGEDRIVGAVQVLNKREGCFVPADLRLIDSLNSHAAAAFVNAILHEEIKKARAEEVEILELSSALSSELSLKPLLVRMMGTIADLLGAERTTLFLYDRRTNELWALVGTGEGLEEIRFPSHLGIAGHVFNTGETVNIPDAYADDRFNREMDQKTGYRTRNILCLPVVARAGEVIGVAQVLNKKDGPFTSLDEKRLRAFTAQASVAMQNAQLFDEIEWMKNFNESILESITNGILTVGPNGVITKANTAALRLLGRLGAPEVVRGQSVSVVCRNGNAWIAEAASEILRDGESLVVMDADVALEGEGGPGRPATASINLAALPFADPKGEPGCLLMIEDVTREKRFRGALSRYLNKALADRLLDEGEAALGGRLQKASVLFSDLRSFTSLSERIGAQETVKLLNEYFSLMADIVLDKGGLLDKYIGDAIMAVFGAPVVGPRDADLAVETAVEMFRALQGFNASRVARGEEPVGMGIGISTDEIVSGNIGSLKRMDYTVIGDGVNVASRLEGANRLYGTQLLLSEMTLRELKTPHVQREIDRIRVRGKLKPVGVFEILDHLDDEAPARSPRFLNAYQKALGLYQRREWAKAREAFGSALEIHTGDAVSRLYVSRCDYFSENPPASDWDGVWEIRDK